MSAELDGEALVLRTDYGPQAFRLSRQARGELLAALLYAEKDEWCGS